MNKNIDYSNLVRVSFAKTVYINPSDIDMHTALWMYGVDDKDKLLQLLYNIEEEGKFNQMHLVSKFFLEKITPDASLSHIANFLPELLKQKTARVRVERAEAKIARLKAEKINPQKTL